MGIVRTIKGDDSKPYISLEDLILEIKSIQDSKEYKESKKEGPNFVDIVIRTLTLMEEEYYDRYLFKNNDNDDELQSDTDNDN